MTRMFSRIKTLLIILVVFEKGEAALKANDDDRTVPSPQSSKFSAIRTNKERRKPLKLRMEDQSALKSINLPETNLADVLSSQQHPLIDTSYNNNNGWIQKTIYDAGLMVTVSGVLAIFAVSIFQSTAPLVFSSSEIFALLYGFSSMIGQYTTGGLIWVELTALTQFIRIPSVGILRYTKTSLIPSAFKMVQRFVIVEIWRRVWSYSGKLFLNKIFPKEIDQNWTESLPTGIKEIVKFVDTSIQHGFESMFKKSVKSFVDKSIIQIIMEYVPQW